MSVAANKTRRGTGSLGKALRLLTEIGSAEPAALRLTDLVSRTDIESSTACRMLSCLVEAEFLEKVDGKRYRLGQRVFELGLVAGQNYRQYAAASPVLRALADHLRAPVTLELCSGSDTVHVANGAAGPAEPMPVGTRRPIGLTSGGVALLASMPPGDADRLLCKNERRYRLHGHGIARELRHQIQRAQRDGYALVTPPYAAEACSVGLIVPMRFAQPSLALSARCDERVHTGAVARLRTAAAAVAAVIQSFAGEQEASATQRSARFARRDESDTIFAASA
jgi:DNA-binding IclR family transcriptional regulator